MSVSVLVSDPNLGCLQRKDNFFAVSSLSLKTNFISVKQSDTS
jgi:hypothetical protein